MKLIFLGTLGEGVRKSHNRRRRSCILVDLEDVKFFLDCGLGNDDLVHKYQPDFILLTHAHPDHAWGIPADYEGLVVMSRETHERLKEDGRLPNKVKVVKRNSKFTVKGIQFRFYPVSHSTKAPANLIIFRVGDKKICYAPDCFWIKGYTKVLNGVNLYIGDGSSIDKDLIRRCKVHNEPVGHWSIRKQMDILAKVDVPYIIFSHVGEQIQEIDDRRVLSMIRSFTKHDCVVELAHDGMEIDLEELAKTKPVYGLYLVTPHAYLIAMGKKKAIVKSKLFKAHINEPLYLIENGLCWGIISLGMPEEITWDEFLERYEEHRVSEPEAIRWGWKNKKVLYLYPVKIIQIFTLPKPVRIPRGVQVFVSADRIEWLSIHQASIEALEMLHALIHSKTALSFLPIHEAIVTSFSERNAIHVRRDKFYDYQELIQSIEEYDPSKLDDKVLADDWRIVCAWYSTLKRKGEFKYSEEQILSLACKIIKEMDKRGFKFHPESMKKYSRELFEKALEILKEQGVEITLANEEWAKIDEEYVKELSDEELLDLHDKLHEDAKPYIEANKRIPEELVNAHIFVWEEMRERKLKHEIKDQLDQESLFMVYEYPSPPEGIYGYPYPAPEKMSDVITLREFLNTLPSHVSIKMPIAWVVGGIVNRGAVTSGHDIDFLVSVPPRYFREFVAQFTKDLPEHIRKRLHFILDWEDTPMIGHSVPCYTLTLTRVESPRLAEETIKPFKKRRMCKPKSGFEKFEFWEVQDAWENWASERIERGLLIQPKYDGMSMFIDYDGKTLKVFTEDKFRDRSKVFKESLKELEENLPKDCPPFILVVEMVAYEPPESGIEVKGDFTKTLEPLPREDMIPFVVATKDLPSDEYVCFWVHDCLYYDEDVHKLPYIERYKLIRKILPKDLKHFKIVPSWKATDMRSFFRVIEKVRRMRASEGAMVKTFDYEWNPKGRTPDCMKLKNMKELDVIVLEKLPVKDQPNVWRYKCGVLLPEKEVKNWSPDYVVEMDGKHYLWIGTTYNTPIKAKKGDILEVRMIRIRRYIDKDTNLPHLSVHPDRVIFIKQGNKVQTLTIEEFWNSLNLPIVRIGEHDAIDLRGLGFETLNENGEWIELQGISRHPYSGELIHLQQKFGETIVTPTHSVMDKDGNVVEAQSNPFLKALRKVQRIGNVQEVTVELEDTVERDGKLFLKPQLLTEEVREKGRIKKYGYSWSDVWLYKKFAGRRLLALVRVLGAYISEGSASKNQTSWRVRFSNQNREWLEFIANEIKLLGNFKVNWEKVKKGRTWNLVIWSKLFYKLVTKYCGKGAKNKKFPEWIFALAPEYQREFLKQISVGDGVHQNGVASSSPKVIAGFCLLKAMLEEDFSIWYTGKGLYRLHEIRKRYDSLAKKRMQKFNYKGYVYDLQTESGFFIDGLGLVVCKNTWMFPVVIRKRTDKKEPDPLSQALKIEKVGVHPLHELSADTIIRINLPPCPYWTDPNICPLRIKFRLSTVVIEEYLRFPIKCALAKYFKCRYVKPYYYSIRVKDIKECDDLVY